MARVEEAEITRLKTEVSVERLAERAGVELKLQGKDLLGRCPFHDDKTPSLVISPEKNLWHCLGACQAGGSVIDWVMRAEGVSFRHAVELLRGDIPSLAAELPRGRGTKVAKKSTTQKLEPLAEASVSDQELLGRVVSYYTETLKKSPEALKYLESRGLRNSEMIEHFRLGYADRTLGYRLPAKNRKEGAEVRGRLLALGILRESGHEHLRGSITVPIFDEAGRVVEMYGRKVGTHLREGTPNHLYLPGPHRGVFNWQALGSSKEVIVCESLIDALTFWCAGYRNVTCAYGVEGFGPDHWEALKKYEIKRVLIAYDRDEAGDRAAERLAAELTGAGIEAFRVKFPKGMDANEYALKVTPAEKSLGTALRSAEWMGSGVRSSGVPASAPEPARHEATKEENPPAEEKEAEPSHSVMDVSVSSLELACDVALEADETVSVEVSEEAGEEETFPHLAAERAGYEATAREAEPVGRKDSSLPAEQASGAERVSRMERTEPVSQNGDELVMVLGSRRWRVRGLSKNTSGASLKVNLLVTEAGSGAFHVDSLELYSARQRAGYVKQASEELRAEERVLKQELGQVLLKLEEQQERRALEAEPLSAKVELTEAEKREALDLLRDPRLLERITGDLGRCGLIGEDANKLTAYLAATSRKLERPLAIVVQSSSAAGKSSLMDAILRMMPEEERVSYSAMTGQSLFYMGETNLSHKILAIAEEEGAERAAYALKLLQSEGELTIASTGKDPSTGRLITQEYRVEGPVMIFLTTTAIEVDEELLNRCIVLTVDETRAQTRAIHEAQRWSETLEGLLEVQRRSELYRLHQNAQRLIRPLLVANPLAKELSFLDHQTRTRRDHMKYLTMIRAVALLHQYQRPVKTAQVLRGREVRYIEVTEGDIEVATRLCERALGTSLDELPPKTRELLERLGAWVRERAEKVGAATRDVRFTRREVREATGLGDTQLKVHLGRLVELEHLHLLHDRHSQRFVYALGEPGGSETGHICGYEEKPVGGGRGRSDEGGGPVLAKESSELTKPVGANAGPRRAGARNGASYAKAHISSLVAHGAQAALEA